MPNATGNVYAADIADVRERQGAMWEQQNRILGEINSIANGSREWNII
jgi:hypothetical protein